MNYQYKHLLIAIAMLLTLNCQNSYAGEFSISEAESQNINDYIKNYHRGVVITKTAKSSLGEPVSCVDINHQPALNNPLLKGHKLQLQPSPELKAILKNVKQGDVVSECPSGSVEMILPTYERIAVFGSLEKFHSKHGDGKHSSLPIDGEPPAFNASRHEYAVADQTVNTIAAQTFFNVWAPSVSPDAAFSLSQLWIAGGTGSSLQTIEVGWHVYPALHQDNFPHFFIFYTSDNYQKNYCYNIYCQAFVQTIPNLVGAILPSSSLNGTQIEVGIAVYRDPATGNWILFYVDANGAYTQIGYYPKSLFGSGQLSQYAQTIKFGGEVALYAEAPVSPHTATDMGSGNQPFFLGSSYGRSAYQRNILYADTNGVVHDAVFNGTYNSNSYCYSSSAGNVTSQAPWGGLPSWGSSIIFGGTGYSANCP